MTNKPSMQNAAAVPDNLQRTFENAVRDIYQVSLTGTISRRRIPIAQRVGSPESKFHAEKRALSDAAKALAQLWKVAPNR